MFTFTDHARRRCAQRNLSRDEVGYVIQYGTVTRRAGAVFYYLRQTDIPKADRSDQRLAQLHGSTVVMDKQCTYVITVYRNPEAYKRDRRKARFDRYRKH